MLTLKYFDYYCKKYYKIFDKLNKLEQKNEFFCSSYASLERYRDFHEYLINNSLIKNNIRVLDLGCYMGFYIKFLNDIGIKEAYGVDYNNKAILFGKKLGINNIFYGDIRKMDKIDLIKEEFFDYISILHTFEYSYIEINGNSFIYETLKQGYSKLKKGGMIFFTIGEGYRQYNKDNNQYNNVEGKVSFDTNKMLNIGFRDFKDLGNKNYLLIK